jgi:hypothetical protein
MAERQRQNIVMQLISLASCIGGIGILLHGSKRTRPGELSVIRRWLFRSM